MQLAATFTHQALGVREALLKNSNARKRELALILHDKVRSEALAISHEANAISLNAEREGFGSPVFEQLRDKRAKLDPISSMHVVSDVDAYEKVGKLSESKLDTLIDLLTVECITAHLKRRTELVCALATELKVAVRDHWRPDTAWLSGFQKIQLAHLIVELRGAVHAPDPQRKKSELVEVLATLFDDAAQGRLEDKTLAAQVNAWLPSNLRDPAVTKKPQNATPAKRH